MALYKDFIFGKLLEEVDSPINGKIKVIKSLGFGTYIQVGNLTQSGGVVVDVWKSSLKNIYKLKPKIKSSLILGLGGGSAAKLINGFWPGTKITGVDVDFRFVELGKKYLGLTKIPLTIEIQDAGLFIAETANRKDKYDLILVDMYLGDKVPENFETENFIQNIKKLLKKNGIAVFNRLYYGEKRSLAIKFLKKLEKAFKKVIPNYPEANVMFFCFVD